MSDRLTRALLVLTFVTGIVDAVSFVGLGQVFAAMQTGNVIFLGLGIGGSAGAPLLMPLVALLAFLAGGLCAAALGGTAPGGAPNLGPALVLEIALLAAASALAALTDPAPRDGSAYVLVAVLSLTMGLRNTIARRAGGPDLATTVLNLTLVAFTSVAPAGHAPDGALARRGAAFAAILAGAVTGALLLHAGVAVALLAAAVLAAVALRIALGPGVEAAAG
ncbi:MAG TPA: YoaK family protein [Solirubrobacterales bacterium]|nr:YoaK family protein [Solirubrobacterales bacterium]